jgi:hypothetical protein
MAWDSLDLRRKPSMSNALCARCKQSFKKPIASPVILCERCGGVTKNCQGCQRSYNIPPGCSDHGCPRCNAAFQSSSPERSRKQSLGIKVAPTNVGDPIPSLGKKAVKG